MPETQHSDVTREELQNSAACFDDLLPLLQTGTPQPDALMCYNTGVTLTTRLIALIMAKETLEDARKLINPVVRGSKQWAELCRRRNDFDKLIGETSHQLDQFKRENNLGN